MNENYASRSDQSSISFDYEGCSLMSDFRNLIGTPPTSNSPSSASVKSAIPQNFGDDISEYLLILEPTKVLPPDYGSLPPGGCPRFPVIDDLKSDHGLPCYSPTVYKIGIVSRKVEWISPYEPCPLRSWKSTIIELNSTQLNIYQIPRGLEGPLRETQLMRFSPRWETSQQTLDTFASVFTSAEDIRLHTAAKKFGFFDDAQALIVDGQCSNKRLSANAHPNNKQKTLVRSFSLQYAKIGLASDYSKKPNVLRLRLENEQFLLHFSHPKDLIDWNLALSVGRDVASDILIREVPRYRTVPRRRRDRSYSSSDHSLFNTMILRNRKPTSNRLEGAAIKDRLHGLRNLFGFGANKGGTSGRVGNNIMRGISQNRSEHSDTCSLSHEIGSTDYSDCSREGPSMEDENDEDVRNLSDVVRSDDEDEDGYDEDSLVEVSNCEDSSNDVTIADEIFKWNPFKKLESERKMLRNSIKCIKPLVFNESWCNRVLVKVSSSSHFASRMEVGDNVRIRDSYNCGLGSSNDFEPKKHKKGGHYMSGADYATLSKVPDHHLTEYIVGSHALIPKTFS